MTAHRPHRPFASAAALAAGALALAGCDLAGGGSSADTQMRNVEILPGTASDEMITLDQASGDGTSLDTSAAVGPALPGAPSEADAADDAAGDTSDDASDDTSNDGDVVIRPPSGGAEPSDPPTKN